VLVGSGVGVLVGVEVGVGAGVLVGVGTGVLVGVGTGTGVGVEVGSGVGAGVVVGGVVGVEVGVVVGGTGDELRIVTVWAVTMPWLRSSTPRTWTALLSVRSVRLAGIPFFIYVVAKFVVISRSRGVF
jgi:hypothetical protein